jgi:TolB-like protein
MLFNFGSCSIDCDRRELRRGGELVAVEPQVFDVLVYLIRHRDRVVSRDDLLADVWGGRIVSESTLSSRVNSARSAIGDSGDQQQWIRTIARKGFRFVGEVNEQHGPIERDKKLAAAHAGLEIIESSEAEGSAPAFALPDRPSIAVLPFDATGGDPELDAFADGLTEDIITGLSRIKALWVIARNTMFTYKGRAIDVRTVGNQLGVQYVVNGRVRKAERRLRMTAQLVEAETGHHIWAAKIDRDSAGLFELQDDFAQFVVASVQVQLIVSEGKSVARKAKPVSRVGELLARALGRLYQPTADGLREMVSLAERALALDPTSGEACRLLAAGIWHQAYRGIIPWDRSAAGRVMMFAQRAVAAEETDEYSHWILALAYLMACQHDRAIVSLRRALDINPSFSLGYGTLGTVLAWGGEPEESIAK